MRDARDRLAAWLTVGGLFGLFKKKETMAPRRIEVRGLPPPTPAPEVALDAGQPLRHDVLFKGLHEDVNPASNVRAGEMTCQGCERKFRYFMNSSGSKTVCRCPGCGRQYRV